MILWALSLPLVVLLLLGLTFVLYVVEHAVEEADLPAIAQALILPWLWIGFGLDVLMNATVFWAAFAERPREWTISARVRRHIHEGSGWRYTLATWVCETFLRPIDADHCA